MVRLCATAKYSRGKVICIDTVHVALSLKDATTLQSDPVCATLRQHNAASMPSPFKKDLVMMVKIPSVLIPDIQTLQLRNASSVTEASYLRQIQLQSRLPAVFQQLRVSHTIDPASLVHVVQCIPGMPLGDFAEVCKSLLIAVASDLGVGAHLVGTVSSGMAALLHAVAAPLPEIPAVRTLTAQQVAKLWELRTTGRQYMMQDKTLPSVVVTAALLVRLKAGFEQLFSIVNTQPTPLGHPNMFFQAHSDPGIAAAHNAACECVAEDLHALFIVDAHACATLLGVPAISLMGNGEPNMRGIEVVPVPVTQLLDLCHVRGGKHLKVETALTCVGPMFPTSKMAQLRRLHPFVQKLGQYLKGTPHFLKVYRVFCPPATPLPNKLLAFLSRNPMCDVDMLADKIAKDNTIAAIDELKFKHLPWPPTVTNGTKLTRARELAQYILENKREYYQM